MYEKKTELTLLIVEILNIVCTLTFLLLFIRRYRQLKFVSSTFKYQSMSHAIQNTSLK